jgi:hypothetical protein
VLTTAVAFSQIVLAIHIAAVVVAFGVTFAYPLFGAAGARLDARAMPWFHNMQGLINRRLISPGLAVVLIAGIYLASKLHQWHAFYVQWGLGVALVLGGLMGMFFIPTERKLAELAERDVAAAGSGDVKWSDEYNALLRRDAGVGSVASLLVLITVYLMTVRAGA